MWLHTTNTTHYVKEIVLQRSTGNICFMNFDVCLQNYMEQCCDVAKILIVLICVNATKDNDDNQAFAISMCCWGSFWR